MKPLRTRTLLTCFLTVSMIFLSFFNVQANTGEKPTRVLVFPFTIHAQEDMSYLSKAALQMLSSRLAQPGRVEIIQGAKAVSDPSDAVAISARKDADYAVVGSVSIFKDEVSTDAEVYAAGKTQPLMVFHEYSRDGEGALAHIQKLAEQIQQDVLQKLPVPPEPVAEQAPAVISTEEKLDAPSLGFWRSDQLDFNIQSMGVGNVTGDDKNELVATDGTHVRVFGFTENGLIHLFEIPGKSEFKIIGVDVADVNGNQRAELYLTRIRKTGRLSSAVFEWDGEKLAAIAKGLNWFFRVQNALGGKDKHALIGQKQGAFSGMRDQSKKGQFATGVYRLAWQDGDIVDTERLDLAEKTDLYGFAMGDLMGTGQKQTLRYTHKNFLQLMTGQDTEEWRSSVSYGGGLVYLETQPEQHEMEMTTRFYLAQRIRLICDGAGQKCRALVTHNKELGREIFSRFRKFTGGYVEILSWSGSALKTIWQTDQLSGYISEFAIIDMDQDGRKDLVYSQVSGSGSFTRSPTSRVYIQPLPQE